MNSSRSLTAILRVSLLCCTAAFMAGCSTQATKDSETIPDWVTQTPIRSGHAYGVGSAHVYVDKADAINRAGEQARYAMIQKLRVTLSGESSQRVYSRREGTQETAMTKELSQQVSSRIPAVPLDNIEIEQSYVDKQANLAYALAHLDRNKAAAKIRQEMAAIEFGLESARAVPDTDTPLQQLKQLLPALEKFHRLDALAERLQLISPTGNNAPIDASLQELKVRIYRLLDQLVIQIKPQSHQDSRLQQRLIASLTEKGFRIDPNRAPDLRILYRAELRPVQKGAMHYVFADGYIKIEEASGRVLSALNTKIKGASTYPELAENYAVKDLADQLGKKIASTLLDNL